MIQFKMQMSINDIVAGMPGTRDMQELVDMLQHRLLVINNICTVVPRTPNVTLAVYTEIVKNTRGLFGMTNEDCEAAYRHRG